MFVLIDSVWLDLAPAMLAFRETRITPKGLFDVVKISETDSDAYVLKLLFRPLGEDQDIRLAKHEADKVVRYLRNLSNEIEARAKRVQSFDQSFLKLESVVRSLAPTSLYISAKDQREALETEMQQLKQQVDLTRTSERTVLLDCKRILEDDRRRFARVEFLRFCESKLYALTPRNTANALAGIPWMGWRQSIRRTRNVFCPIGKYHYCLAETIKRLLHLSQWSHGGVASIRLWIDAMRPSGSNVIKELQNRDNLLRLSQSAINVQDTSPNLAELPYAIAREYLRIKQSPTAKDLLLREIEALREDSALLDSKTQ